MPLGDTKLNDGLGVSVGGAVYPLPAFVMEYADEMEALKLA